MQCGVSELHNPLCVRRREVNGRVAETQSLWNVYFFNSFKNELHFKKVEVVREGRLFHKYDRPPLQSRACGLQYILTGVEAAVHSKCKVQCEHRRGRSYHMYEEQKADPFHLG